MQHLIGNRATKLWLALMAVAGTCGTGSVVAQTQELGSWVVVATQGDTVRFSAVNGTRRISAEAGDIRRSRKIER